MTYKLNKWRHPSTMEQRVYINHPDLKTKVWFTESSTWGAVAQCEATSRPQHFPIDIREAQVTDCMNALLKEVYEEHDIKPMKVNTWKDLLKNAE